MRRCTDGPHRRQEVATFDFFRIWFQRRSAPPEPPLGPVRTLVGGRSYTFGDDVRSALARAREHALSSGHKILTPAHIALVLLEGDDGPGPALDRLGIDRAALRAKLETPRGRSRGSPDSNLPYDNAAKRSLESAMAEAVEQAHREVRAAHLLAGIVREGRSPAARTLASFGVTLPSLRAALWPDRYGGAE